MAVYCPKTKRKVVYLTCMDCDVKVCKGEIEDCIEKQSPTSQPPLFPNEIIEDKIKED